MGNNSYQVVLLSGKQGSGKTTLSNELQKLLRNTPKRYVVPMNFADTIYKMHDYCRGVLKDLGIPMVNPVKDGDLLQYLGTEYGRKTFGVNVWVNVLNARIRKFLEQRNYDGDAKVVFIVGDCRFRNEFDGLPDALRIRLECDENIRRVRAEMWRANTNHPSETDLDEYAVLGKFDFCYNTEINLPEDIATLVHAQLLKDDWKENRK